jgi:hypothetical protein
MRTIISCARIAIRAIISRARIIRFIKKIISRATCHQDNKHKDEELHPVPYGVREI